MGFKTFGFAGGRQDGLGGRPGLLGSKVAWRRALYSGDRRLENPRRRAEMGLIYVNPEGPTAIRIRFSAKDICETFWSHGDETTKRPSR